MASFSAISESFVSGEFFSLFALVAMMASRDSWPSTIEVDFGNNSLNFNAILSSPLVIYARYTNSPPNRQIMIKSNGNNLEVVAT